MVRVRGEAARALDSLQATFRRATALLVNGIQVGEIFEEQKIYRVVIWGEESIRRDLYALRRLMIDTPSGAQVALGDVCDITIEPAPNVITREGSSRKIDVYCNVEGRDLSSVANDIENVVCENVRSSRDTIPSFWGNTLKHRPLGSDS